MSNSGAILIGSSTKMKYSTWMYRKFPEKVPQGKFSVGGNEYSCRLSSLSQSIESDIGKMETFLNSRNVSIVRKLHNVSEEFDIDVKETAIAIQSFFGDDSFENYFLYYSGHGGETGTWCFENEIVVDGNSSTRTETITFFHIRNWWNYRNRKRKTQRLFIISDCCHSAEWARLCLRDSIKDIHVQSASEKPSYCSSAGSYFLHFLDMNKKYENRVSIEHNLVSEEAKSFVENKKLTWLKAEDPFTEVMNPMSTKNRRYFLGNDNSSTNSNNQQQHSILFFTTTEQQMDQSMDSLTGALEGLVGQGGYRPLSNLQRRRHMLTNTNQMNGIDQPRGVLPGLGDALKKVSRKRKNQHERKYDEFFGDESFVPFSGEGQKSGKKKKKKPKKKRKKYEGKDEVKDPRPEKKRKLD